MNSIKIYSTLLVLFIISLTTYSQPTQNDRLPDSLVTSDNVYHFMFTDTRKAEAIIAALREKGKMPEWELDYTEGDLFYNTGRNYHALKLYAKALNSRKAKGDDKLQMDLMHRMISCYDMTHNEIRKAEYVRRLLKKAEECGDKAMQAVALFNMGKSEYNQGDTEQGCQRMEQAARMMESTNYEYKYDNLRYHYNTLLTYYVQMGQGKDALRVLDELEKVVTASTGKEKVGIDGLDEKERKALYGHRVVVMNMLKRYVEADEWYVKFCSLGKPDDRDQYVVIPYLFDRHMYDEIFRISHLREQRLKAGGDTINYHFTTIRKSLGRAYFETGDYKNAALNYEMLSVLRDSIKKREQNSAALDLAEAYDSAEKDRIIMEQKSQKTIMWLLMGIALVVILVVVIYNHQINRRNVALVRAVKEGLEAKEELLRLRERHEEKHEKRHEESKRDESEVYAHDKEQLERVLYEITARQLYLQPGITPKTIQDTLHVHSTLFGVFFEQETGLKFSDYIKKQRLDYAASLLIEHPNYTIDAVAKMSGCGSRQNFHRLFYNHFGITPSDFRESNKSSDNK